MKIALTTKPSLTRVRSRASSHRDPQDTFVAGQVAAESPEKSLRSAVMRLRALQSAQLDSELEATSDYPNRNGYDENFLGRKLALPKPGRSHQGKLATRLDDSSKTELEYTNFSLVMHKERRQALFTAVNIDGAQLKSVPRDGISWTIDSRIAREHQLGNEAYKNNPIDRGHMVKRLDPVWGDDAVQANSDSFAYTNAGLQHATLNQREWARLENHILRHADSQDQKMTVMTGPIFQSSDRTFDNNGRMSESVQVPEAFWKMAVWNSEDGLKATAFILSQKDLLDDSGIFKTDLEPGRFRLYEVPVEDLAEITDLDFGQVNGTSESVQLV